MGKQDKWGPGGYQGFLKSERWRWLKSMVLGRDKSCRLCGGAPEHVHHLCYCAGADTLPEHLTALCSGCHLEFHETTRLACPKCGPTVRKPRERRVAKRGYRPETWREVLAESAFSVLREHELWFEQWSDWVRYAEENDLSPTIGLPPRLFFGNLVEHGGDGGLEHHAWSMCAASANGFNKPCTWETIRSWIACVDEGDDSELSTLCILDLADVGLTVSEARAALAQIDEREKREMDAAEFTARAAEAGAHA